jgi:uncharacterized protein YecT (DUF1311 family)
MKWFSKWWLIAAFACIGALAHHHARAQEYHSPEMAAQEYNRLAAQCSDNANCWSNEWQRVERVLNNTYKGVQSRLTQAEITTLHNAERGWMVSRDRDCDLISPGRGRGIPYYKCMTEAAINRTAWLMRNIGD